MVKQLKFFTSISINPGDIRKIQKLLADHEVQVNPLAQILITPLFASKSSLQLIRNLKEQQPTTVMFDSGGYYVQTGRITYQELYYPLLQFYRQNHWADIYTLPDYVPTSQDAPDLVQHKVEETAKYSRLFYLEMPDELKPKAMGVVQGHSIAQVEICLNTYFQLGIKKIGFGSFGTVGENSQTNVATDKAVNLAKYVVDMAKRENATVHFFGIGVPALIAMIYGSGAASFDSSSWLKSAGFGQIFLPFSRSYNITHRNGSAAMHRGIRIEDFVKLRNFTEHSCPFCECVEKLQQHKLYRAVHNLICMQETIDRVNDQDLSFIEKVYVHGSPKYRQEFEKWLSPIN